MNLAFIVGCPRSGTSWTWSQLVALPQVEPLLLEDFPLDDSHRGMRQMRGEKEGEYLTTETAVFFSELTDDQIVAAIEKKLAAFPDRLIVEKTPDNARKLDRILRLFPQAKILHIVRDPRAVANSIYQTTFPNGFKFAKDLAGAARVVREVHEASLPFHNHPQVHFLRYETMHADPERVLGEALAFCGFADIPAADLQRAIAANRKALPVKKANLFRRGETEAYREELSPQELENLEMDLRDLLTYYNYALTPRSVLGKMQFAVRCWKRDRARRSSER